jgi:hypothetical protein
VKIFDDLPVVALNSELITDAEKSPCNCSPTEFDNLMVKVIESRGNIFVLFNVTVIFGRVCMPSINIIRSQTGMPSESNNVNWVIPLGRELLGIETFAIFPLNGIAPA